MTRANDGTGLGYELDPDLARLASEQSGAIQNIPNVNVPVTSFVGSLNNQTGNVDIVGGTFDGVAFTFTGGAGDVSLTVTGFGALASIKCNFTAIIAPGATDDTAAGYEIGSQWVDTVLKDGYLCVDATNAAAVWKKTTP